MFLEIMTPLMRSSSVPDLAFRDADDEAFEVDIWCSTDPLGRFTFPKSPLFRNLIADIPGATALRLTVDTQRAISKKLTDHYGPALRKATGQNDIMRWHAMADAPICDVCACMGNSENLGSAYQAVQSIPSWRDRREGVVSD
jgi:hypothetical protein